MLKLSNVQVAFGSYLALREINLEIQPGELVVLLGANGAGKSTLFRAISGLIRPTAGTIRFGDRITNGLPPHQIVRLGISHCPEGRRLFPQMSVHKNLMLGAYARRHDRESLERSLAQVYELFPILKDKANAPEGSLSGGQQQMVAIGRALMSAPKLLMLDEPSLGLAPLVVRHVFEAIRAINQNGTTVFLAEQNAYSALRISHRGYVIENGRIVMADRSDVLAGNELVKRAYIGA